MVDDRQCAQCDLKNQNDDETVAASLCENAELFLSQLRDHRDQLERYNNRTEAVNKLYRGWVLIQIMPPRFQQPHAIWKPLIIHGREGIIGKASI